MKTFNLFTYKCLEEEKKAWEDMCFKLIDEKDLVDDRQDLDVIFGYRLTQDSEVWGTIKKKLPKVLVVKDCRGIVFPKNLNGVYQQQVISAANLSFTLGSKIPGKVRVPDWETYAVNGPLTEAGEVKALAGAVYRFLLEDVMRENEEWCGHMSSVVGPA